MSTPQQPVEPAQPVAQALPADGGNSSMADGEWHRMHPLTPLFKGGLALIVIAGIVISNMRDRLVAWVVNIFAPDGADIDTSNGGDPIDWVIGNNLILVALLATLGIVVLFIAIFWFIWRFQQFRISSDHVEVRKGFVFRSHRRAPLDRVQGVNLTRPFPARLIGLAKLEVVGAGTDANVELDYLATAKAESVRADILRLASGARAVRDGRIAEAQGIASPTAHLRESVNAGVHGLIEGVDLTDVVPESVVKIPTGRLVGSQLISGVVWFLFFVISLGAVMAITLAASGFDGERESWLILLGAVLGTGIPLVIATVAITWAQISKSLRYSIAPTPDGVRITYGLFTTVTETIPPGRIFAVEVSQSLLWRPFGWWTIKIIRMSGKSAAAQQSGTAQQFNVVLPVGKRVDVERVLQLIIPDLPVADVPLVWEHGILGPNQDDPFTRMQARAWWRRPFSWRRHGFALTEFAMIMRRGQMWRKLALFPLARLQGLSVSQGPTNRLQRTAWIKAHSVTGPVLGEVVGIERDAALAVLDQVSHRAAVAASQDRSHRWAETIAGVEVTNAS